MKLTKEALLQKEKDFRAAGEKHQMNAVANFGAADALLKIINEIEPDKPDKEA